MRSEITFLTVAGMTLVAGTAAMRLRNLVHCALCAALAFSGIAVTYLLLGAEFVALAQFLVYVGAVAVLLVFGIMLTRGADLGSGAPIAIQRPALGLFVAAVLCAVLLAALTPAFFDAETPPTPVAPVRQIGERLMSHYVVCLEGIGLLLTAALIGAVVMAMGETPASKRVSLPLPPPRKNLQPVGLP